jgi:hypothetical protein
MNTLRRFWRWLHHWHRKPERVGYVPVWMVALRGPETDNGAGVATMPVSEAVLEDQPMVDHVVDRLYEDLCALYGFRVPWAYITVSAELDIGAPGVYLYGTDHEEEEEHSGT